MRFSANGYYIERYVKCATCGMLVYGEGIAGTRHGKACIYCTPWCVEWAALTDRESGYVSLPIVQPRLPVEDKVVRPERTGEPDPVMMSILDSTMVSICREMGILLMKTSYSTIFNEGLDFTCALADAKGDMIACAEFCPTMIGGMPLADQDLRPGDPVRDPGGGRHRPPQRPLSRRAALPRAHLLQAVLQRRPPARLRRLHRPYRRDRRHGAGCVLRRGDRDLPRGPARPAGQDQEEGPGRRGGLEAAAGQRPHPAPELWRPARHDRLRSTSASPGSARSSPSTARRCSPIPART